MGEKKENLEPNKRISSQLRESFDNQRKVEQQRENKPKTNETQPISQKQIPKKAKQKPDQFSIIQTPCFAETPNTTNQFKNYKIDDKNDNKIQVKMIMSKGIMDQLRDQESP